MISITLRHTLLKIVQKSSAYRGILMFVVEVDVLGGVRPLFLFPEKQLPHPFVHNAKEVFECSWSFKMKLPQAEWPTLAWQNSAE